MAEDAPAITLDEVQRIARLCNLELEPDELPRMARELGDILAYVRQLSELDVSEVPPTMGGLRGARMTPDAVERGPVAPTGDDAADASRVPLRPDAPEASLAPELALREAPRTHDGGFAVPSFVDEG